MKLKIFTNPQPDEQPNSNDAEYDVARKIMDELLRQARLTFNLTVFVNASAALITLSGVGLLYFNKIPEASLTSGGGVLASLCSFQSAKEAKEELRQLMTKLPK